MALNIDTVSPALVCLLTYPRTSREAALARLVELRLLGISRIILEGNLELCGVKILGKGTNSVVFKAYHRSLGTVLIKALRLDASRVTLLREAAILKRVNALGYRPRIFSYSANFIVREYIRGIPLSAWLRTASPHRLRKVLLDLLDMLYRLDRAGISHGELSIPGDHILISEDGSPVIIDYESASLTRKKKNLTQFIQYILFKSRNILENKLKITLDIESIINLLRDYKRSTSGEILIEIERRLGLIKK